MIDRLFDVNLDENHSDAVSGKEGFKAEVSWLDCFAALASSVLPFPAITNSKGVPETNSTPGLGLRPKSLPRPSPKSQGQAGEPQKQMG